MHAFFWPNEIKTDPHGVARLGRVLHWLIVAGAAAVVLGSGSTWLTAFSEHDRNMGLIGVGVGAGTFVFGRAVRYVFSGE